MFYFLFWMSITSKSVTHFLTIVLFFDACAVATQQSNTNDRINKWTEQKYHKKNLVNAIEKAWNRVSGYYIWNVFKIINFEVHGECITPNSAKLHNYFILVINQLKVFDRRNCYSVLEIKDVCLQLCSSFYTNTVNTNGSHSGVFDFIRTIVGSMSEVFRFPMYNGRSARNTSIWYGFQEENRFSLYLISI